MLTSTKITQVYVLDQDQALDFYVGKLGMEVKTDADLTKRVETEAWDHHPNGTLQIGDAALVAAVAADHRAAAFETCARLVDTVKARLPVWKHQHFADAPSLAEPLDVLLRGFDGVGDFRLGQLHAVRCPFGLSQCLNDLGGHAALDSE